jgi:hypothetical protein
VDTIRSVQAKNKINMEKAAKMLCAGFSLGSLFNPKDEVQIFLRKFGSLSRAYMALYLRR